MKSYFKKPVRTIHEDMEIDSNVEVDFQTGTIHYKKDNIKSDYNFSDDHFTYS